MGRMIFSAGTFARVLALRMLPTRAAFAARFPESKDTRFMKFAKISALVALLATVGVAAFAQKPNPVPVAATHVTTATTVKTHTRKLKSGKIVTVKGYTRKTKVVTTAPKTVLVKSYTRKTKGGKVVTVKSYTRKAGVKKMAPKM